jgi:hypothetical protein
MASLGPNGCGTGVDDSSIGTTAWTSPGNITAEDTTYASANLTLGVPSHYLKGTNFAFSIPSGATIDGIVVEWKRFCSVGRGTNTAADNAIRIVKGGTIGATDKSNGSNWPATNGYQSYGSSSDLWGETWSDTDINSSTFGAALSAKATSALATASVDFCRITVYYTAATGPASTTRMVMMGVGM